MGNCLKTQLKESVNNYNLIELGHIQFITTGTVADDPESLRIEFKGVETGDWKSVNNNSVSISQSNDNTISSTDTEIPVGTIVSVSNKYQIRSIVFTNGKIVDSTQLKYINFHNLQLKNTEINCNIEDLVNSASELIRFIITSSSNIYGDVSILSGKVNNDAIVNISYSKVTGSVDTIASTMQSGAQIFMMGSNTTISRDVYTAAINRNVLISLNEDTQIID